MGINLQPKHRLFAPRGVLVSRYYFQIFKVKTMPIPKMTSLTPRGFFLLWKCIPYRSIAQKWSQAPEIRPIADAA